MQKLEAKFTSEWLKWYRANGWFSAPVEIKVVRGKRLNYKSDIKEHQLIALKVANLGNLGYKISDLDQLQKPFDIVCYSKSDAYFCINYNYPQDKEFYLIHINDILKEINSGSKSLTQERAMAICSYASKIK